MVDRSFAPPAKDLLAQGGGGLGEIPNAALPTARQGLTLDATGNIPLGVAALSLLVLTSDPVSPAVGQFWFRGGSLCVRSTTTTTVKVALS